MDDVTIYTRPDCSACVQTKAFLKTNGIEFTEQVIGVDVTREEVVNMFPTARMLPVITTSQKMILNGIEGLKEELENSK